MKQGLQPQGDLFWRHALTENKIPARVQQTVRHLLGELLWTVVEPQAGAARSAAATREDNRDE